MEEDQKVNASATLPAMALAEVEVQQEPQTLIEFSFDPAEEVLSEKYWALLKEVEVSKEEGEVQQMGLFWRAEAAGRHEEEHQL